MHFAIENREKVKNDNPEAAPKEILTLLGKRWNEMTESEKQKYNELAVKDKEKYDNEVKKSGSGKELLSNKTVRKSSPPPKNDRKNIIF